MPGLFLNSYTLSCRGDARLFKMQGVARERTRDELRDLTGVAIWVADEDAFSYAKPSGVDATAVIEPLAPVRGLALWAIREAVVAHSLGLGLDAWIGWGGELHVIGATEASVEDRFRIEHALRLRVARETFIDA